MRCSIQIFILVVVFAVAISAQDKPVLEGGVIRIEARSADGFNYPYYLYIPPSFLEKGAEPGERTILVLPNNTGKNDDDLAVHEENVKRRMEANSRFISGFEVAILSPVFPRPASDWKTYTHALDRDTMLSAKAEKKDYARLDLQLLAMITDARERAKGAGVKLEKRVMMLGFSASAMFVNRFTFLHPGHVKAAVVGSPGGWPMVPASSYKDKDLRYPIGASDLKSIGGKGLDLEKLRTVPMFIFLGDQDDNDSVAFGDSYDVEDRELIFSVLGKNPIDRWEAAKEMYGSAGLDAEFKLYPGVGHTITPEIRDDILAFLKGYAK